MTADYLYLGGFLAVLYVLLAVHVWRQGRAPSPYDWNRE